MTQVWSVAVPPNTQVGWGLVPTPVQVGCTAVLPLVQAPTAGA